MRAMFARDHVPCIYKQKKMECTLNIILRSLRIYTLMGHHNIIMYKNAMLSSHFVVLRMIVDTSIQTGYFMFSLGRARIIYLFYARYINICVLFLLWAKGNIIFRINYCQFNVAIAIANRNKYHRFVNNFKAVKDYHHMISESARLQNRHQSSALKYKSIKMCQTHVYIYFSLNNDHMQRHFTETDAILDIYRSYHC